MNAHQKRAWLVVGSGAACAVAYVVLLHFVGPYTAIASFALFSVSGFAFLIGRGEKMDERDISIGRLAALAGGMASYMVFIIACMGGWFVVYAWHRESQVSVHLLPMITALGAFVFYMVFSVVTLVLYNRHVEANDA